MIDRLIVATLSLFFLFTSIDKVLHYQGFLNALDALRILPAPFGAELAPLVIAAELAIAAGLAVPPWRGIAALQSALLLFLFTVAMAVNQILGGREICGCWFSLSMLPGGLHLFFNGALIALSLAAWHSSRGMAGLAEGRPSLASGSANHPSGGQNGSRSLD